MLITIVGIKSQNHYLSVVPVPACSLMQRFSVGWRLLV